MEWLTVIRKSIDYIEEHLNDMHIEACIKIRDKQLIKR